jgi:hypothetical protein
MSLREAVRSLGAKVLLCYGRAFMPERLFEDSTLPPPGRRHGAGAASIVPYLLKTLATRPRALPPEPGLPTPVVPESRPQVNRPS